MEHTFLLLEGTWESKGRYSDDKNNTVPIEGKAKIIHKKDEWLNEGYMKFSGDNCIEFHNKYKIVPLEKDFTTWKSSNSELGNLSGKFVFIDDTIISLFRSEDNEYFGTEHFVRINDMLYSCKGCLFKGTKKISSWDAQLFLKF